MGGNIISAVCVGSDISSHDPMTTFAGENGPRMAECIRERMGLLEIKRIKPEIGLSMT